MKDHDDFNDDELLIRNIKIFICKSEKPSAEQHVQYNRNDLESGTLREVTCVSDSSHVF